LIAVIPVYAPEIRASGIVPEERLLAFKEVSEAPLPEKVVAVTVPLLLTVRRVVDPLRSLHSPFPAVSVGM